MITRHWPGPSVPDPAIGKTQKSEATPLQGQAQRVRPKACLWSTGWEAWACGQPAGLSKPEGCHVLADPRVVHQAPAFPLRAVFSPPRSAMCVDLVIPAHVLRHFMQ